MFDSPIVYMADHGNTTDVDVRCPFCRTVRPIMHIPSTGIAEWINGTLIQRALPELSASDREGLMTGICDDCFPS